MNNREIRLLEVPLGIEAHRLAEQFAAEQATSQKSKQVYLNTLAVYAVHRYLQWLQVKTNLSQSDSWHPVLRSRWNVADLVISGIGKLECRPVLPGETAFCLPPEVTEDRIGYLGVQFSEHLDQVQLLGFTEAVNVGASSRELLISKLQPLEALLNHIERKKQREEVVNVGLWLRNEIDKWFPSRTWVPLLEPSPLSAMRRSSNEENQEFHAIAREIWQSNQIEIPIEAIGAYQDMEVDGSLVRLYLVTWLLSEDEVREWVLLLVLGATSGTDPTQEIKLQVSDQTGVLDKQVLKLDSSQPYRVVQAVGTLDEEFLVTIASLNGEEPISRLFEYSPEQGL